MYLHLNKKQQFRLTFLSPNFTIYETGTSRDWDGDTKVSLYILPIKTLFCCCLPNHIGIRGNEKADSAAVSALGVPRAKVGVPYNDFNHCFSQYILSTWQDNWNGMVANKFYFAKPVLGDWQSSYRWCSKDEVVLCRTRIDHTHQSSCSSKIYIWKTRCGGTI